MKCFLWKTLRHQIRYDSHQSIGKKRDYNSYQSTGKNFVCFTHFLFVALRRHKFESSIYQNTHTYYRNSKPQISINKLNGCENGAFIRLYLGWSRYGYILLSLLRRNFYYYCMRKRPERKATNYTIETNFQELFHTITNEIKYYFNVLTPIELIRLIIHKLNNATKIPATINPRFFVASLTSPPFADSTI